MRWPEALVLGICAAGATATAILGSFDPLPVYTAAIAWGASRTVTAP